MNTKNPPSCQKYYSEMLYFAPIIKILYFNILFERKAVFIIARKGNNIY